MFWEKNYKKIIKLFNNKTTPEKLSQTEEHHLYIEMSPVKWMKNNS